MISKESKADIARRNGKLGGRPHGAVQRLTRARSHEIATSGNAPFDVMMSNMLFWHQRAQKIGEKLDALVVDIQDPEERSQAFALVKTFLEAREQSQRCAVEAAPYVHPKLQSIALTGGDGGPVEYKRVELVVIDAASEHVEDRNSPSVPTAVAVETV